MALARRPVVKCVATSVTMVTVGNGGLISIEC
jgi:hypothetical protein